MTVTQLVTRVTSMVGWGDTAPTAGTAKANAIQQWLNWAQKLVMRRHNFSCMERTDSSMILLDGQLRYELPPQIKQVINARLIDDTCHVLADCESGWTDGEAKLTTSHDSIFRREGRYSTKIVFASDPTGQISHSADRSSSLDLSAITAGALGFWIYSTSALTAGQVQIVITEDSAGAETTQYITCNVPVVSAYQWTYCRVTTDSSGDALDFSSDGTLIDAFLSIGVKFADDINGDLYIDGINLYDQNYGLRNWPMWIVPSIKLDRLVPNPQYLVEHRPFIMAVSGTDEGGSQKTFEVYSIPDISYPVWWRYYKWPRDLDYANNASDYSELIDLDQILCYAAAMMKFDENREWKSSNELIGRYRSQLKAAKEADELSDGWQPVMEGSCTGGGMWGCDLEVPGNTDAGGVRDSTTGFFYFC